MSKKTDVICEQIGKLTKGFQDVINMHGVDARLDLADWEIAEMLVRYLDEIRGSIVRRDRHREYYQTVANARAKA